MSAWHTASMPWLDGSRAAEVKNKMHRLDINVRQRVGETKPFLWHIIHSSCCYRPLVWPMAHIHDISYNTRPLQFMLCCLVWHNYKSLDLYRMVLPPEKKYKWALWWTLAGEVSSEDLCVVDSSNRLKASTLISVSVLHCPYSISLQQVDGFTRIRMCDHTHTLAGNRY